MKQTYYFYIGGSIIASATAYSEKQAREHILVAPSLYKGMFETPYEFTKRLEKSVAKVF